MNIRKGHKVRVLRDIQRSPGEGKPLQPYASEGEVGRVEETFISGSSGRRLEWTWHAKVRIGQELKTFRLTSLERLA